jgi:hypothetical protein
MFILYFSEDRAKNNPGLRLEKETRTRTEKKMGIEGEM